MDSPPIIRHSSLYFEDGDLELSAKTSEGSIELFKVYRAQLRRVSPVFKDMLSLGGDREEVVIMPDPATDLSALLQSVYNASSLVRRLTNTPQARCAIELAGLVRIARKYGVDDIAEVAVEHIQQQWPNSLAEWDALYPTWKANSRISDKRDSVPEPISAISFAMEFGVHSILPAAFYMLAIQASDTDVSVPAADAEAPALGVRWELSNHAILLHLIRGRDRIRKEALVHLTCERCYSMPHAAPTGAIKLVGASLSTSGSGCNNSKDDIQLAVLRGDSSQAQWDYLKMLHMLSTRVDACNKICSPCKRNIIRNIVATRSHIWQKLPEYFDCPKPMQPHGST